MSEDRTITREMYEALKLGQRVQCPICPSELLACLLRRYHATGTRKTPLGIWIDAPQTDDIKRQVEAFEREERGAMKKDPEATIRRLRQRLYIVEPVFRAVVAAYRNGAPRGHEEQVHIERRVDHALDLQYEIANGGSISDATLDTFIPIEDYE